MSLLALPSPVVNCILSYLDAEDFINYLSVVSPGNYNHLSPHTFKLARNFHGSEKDAEKLLRFARRSRRIVFFGCMMNLTVCRFSRLINQLTHVHHLDLTGLVLVRDDLSKFMPVLTRVKSLRYRSICKGIPTWLSDLPTERGDDDPFKNLEHLHIIVDFRSADMLFRIFLKSNPRGPHRYDINELIRGAPLNLKTCLLPGLKAKLRVKYFGLELSTPKEVDLSGELDIIGFAKTFLVPSEVEELYLTCQGSVVILSSFHVFSRATKITLATKKMSLPSITQTIEKHLLKMPAHHPEIEPIALTDGRMVRTLCFEPVRYLMENKEQKTSADASGNRIECPISFLFEAGNVVSCTLVWDMRHPEWICQKSYSSTTIFELSDRNIFHDRMLCLSDVKELVIYLDDHEVEQQLASLSGDARGLQPTRLRLLVREHIPSGQRASVMKSLLLVLMHFTRLTEVSILGFAYLRANDLLHIFDHLFPTLTRLQLTHHCFYNWVPNSSLVRLPQCLSRLLKLRHLSIVCRSTCWDEQIINPTRLFPVLANLPCLLTFDLFVPHLSKIYDYEAAFHELLASVNLNTVWIMVPDLSTSTTHLVVKRLRATVKQTNKTTGRRLMFRISSTESNIRMNESRNGEIPIPLSYSVCRSPFPF